MGTTVRGFLALVLIAGGLLGPQAALAQGMDPAVMGAVAAGVQATAGIATTGGASVPQSVRPAEIALPTPAPEATPVPSDEPLAPVDLNEVDAYEQDDISLLIPSAWLVEEGVGREDVLSVSIPGSEAAVMIMRTSDFPGAMGLVLFAQMSELFVTEYMGDAELTGSEAFYSDAGLPVARVDFDADLDGIPAKGVLYLLTPGIEVYMVIGVAPEDQWEAVAPGIELMATSMTFAPETITLQTAGPGGLDFSDATGVLSVIVPEGWLVTDTDDETIPVVITEPDLKWAAMLGTQESFDADIDIDVDEVLEQLTSGDPEVAEQDAIDAILEGMGDAGFDLDRERSQITTRDGAFTVRLVGQTEFAPDQAIQMLLYMDMRADGGVVLLVMGDVADALSQTALFEEMLESVVLE
jgi:hypothetical protein